MYAVIESGGKQYRVELGSEIQVDRLDVRPGDNITLERVLLVADGNATTVGRPVVDGATVSAEVLRQERGDKVVVFKYKPKARRRVKKGARAELTRLRIADIAFSGKSAAKDARAADSQKARSSREAEKAAAEKAAADQALAAQLAATAAPAGSPEKGTEPTSARPSRKAKAAEPAGEPAEAGTPDTETVSRPAVAPVPEVADEPAGEPAEAAETETRKDD